MDGFIHSWSGEASQWECDELGHLNMRFYMYKIKQARQMLFIRLGLVECFKKGANSTVRLDEFHIKYLSEARPGAPLHIHSAILDHTDQAMTLIHVMRHHDDRPACTVIETVSHTSRHTLATFNWPSRVMNAAHSYHAQRPDYAAPRGLDISQPSKPPSYAQAQDTGMSFIGLGVFQNQEADIFGNIAPEAIMGRVAQTVGNFVKAWPEMLNGNGQSGPEIEPPVNGVLLEARLIMHSRPEPGDPYEFYSGVKNVNANIRDLVHCLYNPVNGEIWTSMQAIGGLIDLNARKHVKTSAQTMAAMRAIQIKGLSA